MLDRLSPVAFGVVCENINSSQIALIYMPSLPVIDAISGLSCGHCRLSFIEKSNAFISEDHLEKAVVSAMFRLS